MNSSNLCSSWPSLSCPSCRRFARGVVFETLATGVSPEAGRANGRCLEVLLPLFMRILLQSLRHRCHLCWRTKRRGPRTGSALGNADGALLESISPVMARRIHPPTRPPATEESTSHGGNELALTPTHEPSDSTNEWVRLDVDNGQPGDDLELFPLEDTAPIESTIDAERPISAELSGAAESSGHFLPSPAPVAEHASSAATLAAVRPSRKPRRHPSLKSLGVIASGFVLGFASFRFGATKPPHTSQAAGATMERPNIDRDANRLIPPDPAGGGMRLTSESEHQGRKVDSAAADPARDVAPPAESTAYRARENSAATTTTAPPNAC
jgi:hypothetical protein